jgi:acetyl-CoA acetyltransferase
MWKRGECIEKSGDHWCSPDTVVCTGSRVLVTVLHEMKLRNSRFGLECICGAGGLGIAAAFDRI